ncbi:MAG TPA: ABC transporter permease [Pirellulales bacterium]|jgi:putative ABC transport system permease protein|nr:ABC transporter permease [Pirellulales bacterium]
MSLWKIAWRSIQQRALASSLTGISMALGVMLVVAVLVVHGVINRSFLNNSALGYNVVVGAKGGRLDLVLNSVYYLARPVENIPYSYYLELAEGNLKPYVDKAVPVCLGDMYRDFRVVGTTPAFFNDLDYGGHKYTFAEGRNFEPDEYYGAVIGATVARESGLRVHDTFQPAHGVGPEAHEHDPFTVLGVLEPTGTPNDRALFINMEGFYLIPEHAKQVDESEPATKPAHADHAHDEHAHDDHDKPDAKADDHPAGEDGAHEEHAHAEHSQPADAPHEHADHEHAEAAHTHDEHAHDEHGHHHHEHGEHAHEPLPIEQREVTAVLVLTASIGGAPPELMAPALIKKINKDSVAQAVLPIREMTSLFATFVDPLRIILLSLTVMIVVVSGIGILVSIYNSMSERQHEIAVMRALGAGRRTVMVLVLLESILLSLAGGLAGWAVGHALIALLSPWIAAQTGVSIGFWQFVGYESVIIPGLIALAALVGYLPALAAYRTDVAKALGANP